MRTCLLNDCTGFEGIAPCCLDCREREACSDKCYKTETTYCVGIIENYDSKEVEDEE